MAHHITGSIKSAAAPAAIWALMSDMKRLPDFVDDIDRMIDVPDGEIGTGYRYRAYEGIPPFKGEMGWVVTEWDPPRRQVHVGDDGMTTIVFALDLVPVPDGTRVDVGLEITPRWFIRPIDLVLWPLLMRRRSEASMDRTMANIGRLAATV